MDSTAQPQQIAANRRIPFFNRGNAAEMAKLKWAAWHQKKLERKPTEEPPQEPMQVKASSYQEEQLLRARAQIDAINSTIDQEAAKGCDCNAQTIERLTRSLGLLSERERILDGRPLPGALRPVAQRKPQAPYVEPL